MKNPSWTSYNVVTLTDVGIKRNGSPNQDSVGSVLPWLLQPRPPLLILADGMGGYAGGSQASQLVIQAFKRVYLSYKQGASMLPILEAAVQSAHADIRNYSKNKLELESMGSTVVAVVLEAKHAKIINVNNIGVSQARQGFCFPFKPFKNAIDIHPAKFVNADDFNSHITFQPGIEGFVNSCHAALAQLFEDVVTTKGLTD